MENDNVAQLAQSSEMRGTCPKERSVRGRAHGLLEFPLLWELDKPLQVQGSKGNAKTQGSDQNLPFITYRCSW